MNFTESIIEILKKSKGNNEIVSLFTELNEPDNFWAGFVGRISDEFIMLNGVCSRGRYEWFRINKISDIYKIEFGGKYQEKLEKLYLLQNQNHKPVTKLSEDLISDLLIFAKENKLIATIQIRDSGYDDIIGYIEDLTDETVKIKLLDEFGDEDGFSVFNKNDITLLACDNDMTLKLLSEN